MGELTLLCEGKDLGIVLGIQGFQQAEMSGRCPQVRLKSGNMVAHGPFALIHSETCRVSLRGTPCGKHSPTLQGILLQGVLGILDVGELLRGPEPPRVGEGGGIGQIKNWRIFFPALTGLRGGGQPLRRREELREIEEDG